MSRLLARVILRCLIIGISFSIVVACGGDLERMLTIVYVEEELPSGERVPVDGARVVHRIKYDLRIASGLDYEDVTDASGVSAVMRGVPTAYDAARMNALLPRATHPDGRTADGSGRIEPSFDFGNWFKTFWPVPFDAAQIIDLVCGTIVGIATCDPGSLLSTNFVIWGGGAKVLFTPIPEPTPSATPTATPTPTASPTPTVTPTPTATPTVTPTPTNTPTPTPSPTPSGRTQLISASIREIEGCDVRIGAEAKAKDDLAKRITLMVIEVDGTTIYDSGNVNLAALQAIVDLKAPTGRHTFTVKVWDNADFRNSPVSQDGSFETDCSGVTDLIIDQIDEIYTDPDNQPPEVGPIVAVLNPPVTNYSVAATDPEGDELTFTWSRSAEACGAFSSSGATSAWPHPHPGPGPIECGDEVSHPGTVTVVVSDGHGNEIIRSYEGTLDGVGETD